MYELPRGYKLKRKPEEKKGKRYNEVYICMKVPAKYKLSDEDIEYINIECIKPEDCFRLTKNKSGNVYANAFDVSEKKINTQKIVEGLPRRFTNVVKKFRDCQNPS